jgi:hypothetical protein
MLVLRTFDIVTGSRTRLKDLRNQVDSYLEPMVSSHLKARLLLAVHEIIANTMRHSETTATHILVDITSIDGIDCCVVRDNGNAFSEFGTVWQTCQQHQSQPLFLNYYLGLSMVCSLWPQARYYVADESSFNSFILPLDDRGVATLPNYFKPVEKTQQVAAC